MNHFLRLAILSIFLGLAGGLLFPAPLSAASGITVSLSVNPGGQDTMTCGWHHVCKAGSYAPYTALDWRNQGTNPPVYWRSWGFRSDGQTGNIAIGRILTLNTSCYFVAVRVRDIFDYSKGDVYYTHTRTNSHGTEFSIGAAPPLGGLFTSHAVGYSVAQEICSDFDGQHLHQYAEYGPPYLWGKAGPYPNAPAPTASYSPITAQGHLQATHSWCWFC